jgi:hypothetical protein
VKRINLTGLRQGRLRVLREEGSYAICECDCGTVKTILRHNVRAGYTQSCGCLQKNRARQANVTHGASHTQLYSVWQAMKARCYGTTTRHYKWYGAKGIIVCEKWQTYEGFFEDMGESYKPGLTLDRINSSKNYQPDNCRWLSKSDNARGRHAEKLS